MAISYLANRESLTILCEAHKGTSNDYRTGICVNLALMQRLTK